MDNNNMPLTGVKVVDLTTFVAAPASTSALGYLGADVIKIEPLKGDPYRYSGTGYGVATSDEINPINDTCNGFKRDISVDFRSSGGKEVIRRLIKNADIMVTNYREDALRGMGFNYDEVIKINPRIVYGHINGYGEKGVDAPRPGFDSVAFYARSGFSMSATTKTSVPMPGLTGTGDIISSMALTVGVLAAYLKTRETGKSEKVSCSLYSSALWVMGVQIALAQFGFRVPCTWEEPSQLPTIHDYRTSDGEWIRLCCIDIKRTWEPLCRALDLEEYTEDERFSTSGPLHDNRATGVKIIQEKIKTNTYAYWASRLKENDIAFERQRRVVEIPDDEQARVNGFLSSLVYPNGKEVYLAMPPFKLKNAGDRKKVMGPKLGEHTLDIMREYGFTKEEIDNMLSEGAIKQF